MRLLAGFQVFDPNNRCFSLIKQMFKLESFFTLFVSVAMLLAENCI